MPRPPTRLDELPAERDLGGLSGRILGQGPRLVLLHGGPGLDHHLLLPLALELSGRHEVLVPDLPGHGASPHARRGSLTLEELIRATAAWLEALDPQPVGLVGHSLGAHLVLRLLSDGRPRLRRAVLLAPPGPLPSGSGDRLQAAESDPRRLRAELLGLLRSEGEAELAPEVVEAVERCQLRSPLASAQLLSQLRRKLRQPAVRIRRRCRTLILTGELDGVAPPDSAEALAAALPSAELQVLPGRGHWCAVARAPEVAERLRPFLADATS